MNKTVLCAGTYVVDIMTAALNGPLMPQSGHHISVTSHPGGNALNTAVNLSNLGLPGKKIICCGALGDDFEGHFLKTALKKAGIKNKTAAIKGSRTSKSLILSFKNGERSFIVDKGASLKFTRQMLVPVLEKIKPYIFYIGESAASPDIDKNLPQILRTAKETGCITMVDYITLDDSYSDSVFSCAPYTDIIHLNEFEAKTVTGTDDIKRAALFLREKGFPLVFVSEGEKGFVMSCGEITLKFPVFPVYCADATGAGDAFCSGIMHFIYTHGGIPRTREELTGLALYASACGAAAVAKTGCTGGVSAKAVREILDKNKTAVIKKLDIPDI
ncbi:MAG: carbohydrate kinase family protein [Candidatus Goldiibacteriota bacterium]